MVLHFTLSCLSFDKSFLNKHIITKLSKNFILLSQSVSQTKVIFYIMYLDMIQKSKRKYNQQLSELKYGMFAHDICFCELMQIRMYQTHVKGIGIPIMWYQFKIQTIEFEIHDVCLVTGVYLYLRYAHICVRIYQHQFGMKTNLIM